MHARTSVLWCVMLAVMVGLNADVAGQNGMTLSGRLIDSLTTRPIRVRVFFS